MMNINKAKRIFIYLVLFGVGTFNLSAETHIDWQNLGDVEGPDGWHFVQRVTVTGDTDMKGLAFNMFARKMRMTNPLDTLTEIIPGYYLITSPRFQTKADSLIFDIDSKGYFTTCSYTPDGFHKVLSDNTSAPVTTTRQKFTEPSLYHAFAANKYPRAEEIYDFNECLKTEWSPGVYDIIPSFSKVQLTGGESEFKNKQIEIEINEDTLSLNRPNYATIVVNDGLIKVISDDERCARSAARVFDAKVLRNLSDPLPNAVLEYSPEFEWRGIMIDIARNFQKPETLKDVLNLMADNGLNKLHFHVVDDEAWRLEIPSLPELTEVSSRRGWATDETDHLYQLFTGDGNPDNYENTSNGHLSKQDFIDLLRTAYDLGIDIVPEIESPGHARAAIRAMEVRAANGDISLRLIDDNDTSVYTSAQSLHDNVMNPALESTYKFLTVVYDDIIDMYKEAGVPLTGIHIGGDEVPRGAWLGSQAVADFMKENSIEDEKALHAYFVKRLAHILKDRNVPVYGWQEIALGHGAEYDTEIAPLTGGINAWSTKVKKGELPVPVRAVQSGYPTILSNVEHFYFDLSYNEHPAEPGLRWGGHTNEFTAFDGYAAKLCPAVGQNGGKVIGLNAQVFGETMRSPDQLLMSLTPKIFGLAERAAHPDSTYTKAQFNKIIGNKELPNAEKRFNNNNCGYVHVNQPGIKQLDGKVYINAPYEGGTIRYTLDGTEPTEKSATYTGPLSIKNGEEVRARYYRNGGESVTTYFNL